MHMAVDEADELEALVLSYALGSAPREERARLGRLVETDPALAALISEADEAIEAAAMGFAAPRLPWQAVLQQLEGARRFDQLVPSVATLFDVGEAQARALLARIDDPSQWLEGPGPGAWLMPVDAGPRWSGYVCTLLRLDPGATFPLHTHGTEEQVLVLEGGYRDDASALEFWRGALDVRASGTSHSFTALPGLACVCASVVGLPEDG
ncbi:MAG: cupin domain-containing protein [Myxococcus sp.]|nr:cupin domain-containing protein [Myxococcus sp.]